MEKEFYKDLTKDELISMVRELTKVEAPQVKAIRHPADVVRTLESWSTREQEHFLVVTLNGAHEMIEVHEISKGTVNRSLVHPREVFRAAIGDNAIGVVVAHNHPSGHTEPSDEDIALTERLRDAGEIIGIQVLDSVILGKEGSYYSFLEAGKMP